MLSFVETKNHFVQISLQFFKKEMLIWNWKATGVLARYLISYSCPWLPSAPVSRVPLFPPSNTTSISVIIFGSNLTTLPWSYPVPPLPPLVPFVTLAARRPTWPIQASGGGRCRGWGGGGRREFCDPLSMNNPTPPPRSHLCFSLVAVYKATWRWGLGDALAKH